MRHILSHVNSILVVPIHKTENAPCVLLIAPENRTIWLDEEGVRQFMDQVVILMVN